MPKYRKKPVVIEAVKWEGTKEAWDKILKMGLENWEPGEIGSNTFYIETLGGDIKVYIGDYIIKGVNGEFYPCKPDIFHKTYEKVEEVD